MIVAVDGPSASGKSTVARGVAESLRLPYLDTGSMYRALTWAVLERGVDPDDPETCAEVARAVELEILGPGRIAVDGRDVSTEIRGPDVTAVVSSVSAHLGVRRQLVEQQRAYAAGRGAVVEGRDIGTVVFPGALLKVFLTADDSERQRRRSAEIGPDAGQDIARRDQADAARRASPLVMAEDAVVIDTTGRNPAEVISEVVELVQARRRARLRASDRGRR